MEFWKMNGAGNDFIIINGLKDHIKEENIPEVVRALCERHMSIGADGFIIVDKASDPSVDFRMRFFNSDGTVGELCGNGARCICRYGYENGLSGETQVIETTAGIVAGKRKDARNYRIRLTDPSLIELDKILQLDGESFHTDYLLLGDPGLPHIVIDYSKEIAGKPFSELSSGVYPKHLKDAPLNELRELGRRLRSHKDLPKGANVNFYEFTGVDEIDELTFERGVEDFTYACGTGTGSVAASLTIRELISGTDLKVNVKGGTLYADIEEVDIDEKNHADVHGIFITGPTNIVCKGSVTDEDIPDLLN